MTLSVLSGLILTLSELMTLSGGYGVFVRGRKWRFHLRGVPDFKKINSVLQAFPIHYVHYDPFTLCSVHIMFFMFTIVHYPHVPYGSELTNRDHPSGSTNHLILPLYSTPSPFYSTLYSTLYPFIPPLSIPPLYSYPFILPLIHSTTLP